MRASERSLDSHLVKAVATSDTNAAKSVVSSWGTRKQKVFKTKAGSRKGEGEGEGDASTWHILANNYPLEKKFYPSFAETFQNVP